VAIPALSPEQARQKQAALLRVEGIKAADASGIRRITGAKTVMPTPERKMCDGTQRGQLFIAVTLLPVELGITRLAKPGQRIKGVI
jgi:hypothetical protein